MWAKNYRNWLTFVETAVKFKKGDVLWTTVQYYHLVASGKSVRVGQSVDISVRNVIQK